MNILVLDEEFPHPLNTGKRIRTFSLTRALTAHNNVSYLAYGDNSSEAATALRNHGIETHAVRDLDREKSGPAFYFRLLLNLLSPLPYIVTSHHTSRFDRKLREVLDTDAIDMIICEWTPYAMYVRDLLQPKSIVVAHNIEANIWRRYEQNERNPLKRAYISIQRAKVEKFERACFGWADGATAVSAIEAEEIAGYGVPYRVETVDNGVDTEYFAPQEVVIDPDQLVFTGSMDWRPNQDAIEYFVTEVFPLARRVRPNLKIDVVGRKPPSHIRDLGKVSGVTITGTVDDVRPYIARAALYVVPLRIGGGSRLKILEAMAMRKPILSTGVGAEGLNVTSERHLILADGTREIAAGIERCLTDPDLCRTIAANGRELVLDRYRWSSLGDKLHHYLTEVAARP
ncbi:MAG: glycosyltransferase, partial [candidate division Zixibacteria bacterium]|nr:glycosyltransferase [candidate division Zixibacteria bacterium]